MGRKAREQQLRVTDLHKIGKLMEIYEGYKQWEWRFGSTPSFTNEIEKKFEWALVDVHFNVDKGKISNGKVYSDCLVPTFIDEVNEILASGLIKYDTEGIDQIGR